MSEIQAPADQAVAQLKVPPQSKEAEQSVLAGIMLDQEAWSKIDSKLTEIDFYQPQHKILFRAMVGLAKRNMPQDAITLIDYLKEHDQLKEIGGEPFIYELQNSVSGTSNIVAYADIVRERSVMRQLIQAANDIAERAYQPKGMDCVQLLDEAERKVFEIAEQGVSNSGPVGIKSVLAKTVDRIDTLFNTQGSITGLPSGFDDLDEMTSGLQAADLIIVAGRPSMGKTTFAMNIAENAAFNPEKKPVLVFSLEMPAESLAMRMLSSLGRIDQHRLRSGNLTDDDWARINANISLLSQAPLFIDDQAALSPAEMRSRARRVAKEHGQLGLIVIDYLQLMQVPGLSENRTAEVSEISRSLKALAKELDVPVIALSQLNRSLEQRADKRPVMSDLRESGAIEQDADVIAFVYRDEVYNENSPDKGTAEIIIGKQRNGPIGRVRLTFIGQYTRFENFANDQFGGGFE
jgi:replicative DNA helicase